MKKIGSTKKKKKSRRLVIIMVIKLITLSILGSDVNGNDIGRKCHSY